MAFNVYCEKNGNMSQTLIELERRGLPVCRKTLTRWAAENRFKDGLKPESGRQQKDIPFDQQMISKLVAQIDKYERYFESIESIDNRAVYAYTNLLKTIVELGRKAKPRGKDPEGLRKKADEILEAEYGIKR